MGASTRHPASRASRPVATTEGRALLNGRNLFDLEAMRSLGFHYESVGREVIN